MDSQPSRPLQLFDIYARYSGIVSRHENGKSKEELASLLKLVASGGQPGHYCEKSWIFEELSKLMSYLNLTVEDSQCFTCFYDFVFFICRESGQKNISVKMAVTAWTLVLNGRFRLLDQWCEFVENHQRHNISEDTWQQLLAFSRCVNEDLGGYDPKGAWPILIDEFVEHMYRYRSESSDKSNGCSTQNISFDCGEIEPCTPSLFTGLREIPGMKRKCVVHGNEVPSCSSWSLMGSEHFLKCKRSRQTAVADKQSSWDVNTPDDCVEVCKHSPRGCSNALSCAVEGSLLRGFEGLVSLGTHIQFDQGRRVSFT